jgi:error-prone DNA polymerase
VIFQNIFDRFRKAVLGATLLMVEGTLQIEGQVIHVVVRKCHDMTQLLARLRVQDATQPPVGPAATGPVQLQIFPDARNFK